MAQSVAVVRSTLPNSGGTTDLTSTGFGTPAAAIVFFCTASSTSNPTSTGILSVGFWDGTNQRGHSIAVSDNVSGAIDYKDGSTTGIPLANPPGSVRYYAISSITDGIRLTASGPSTAASRYVTAILLSGVSAKVGSITPNSTVSGTQASASLGFAPKMVFFTTVGDNSFGETSGANVSLSFGVAESAGGTNRTALIADKDGAGTTATNAYYSESYAMAKVESDVLGWAADVTTFGADTFTITTRNATTGADVAAFLALGGANFTAEVGALTTRTTTGHDVTNTSSQSKALLTAMTTASTTGTIQTSGATGLAFGLADANGQFSHNASFTDNSGTQYSGSAAQAAAIMDLNGEDGFGSRVDLCDATVALNSTNFDLNYTTVSGTARKGFYVSFGTTSGNTIAVPKGSLVLTTKVPTVTTGDNKTIAVPKGALSLTGKTPTVTATQHNFVSVPLATLRLTALAPTIIGAEPVRRSTAAGSARGAGKKRRKFVELDGQLVEVRSAKEAVAKIQAFAEKVKAEVQTKVAATVVKAVQRGEVAEITPPEIAVSDTLQQAVPQIEAIQQQINRAYEQAFIAMQQALEEDDEEAIFVLTH